MDSDYGGLSKDERQKRAAAAIARRKVIEAYSQGEQARTRTDDNVSRTVSRAEWQKYHSAWQQYYQKYYSEYYSAAAKTYIQQQTHQSTTQKPSASSDSHSAQAPSDDARRIISSGQDRSTADGFRSDDTTSALSSVAARLRHNIRSKASDSASKSRRYRKFLPIFAGLAVIIILLFLQYNRLIFAPLAAYVSPGDAPASEITAVNPTTSTSVSADPKLIIPKLNVEVPVAFGISLDSVDSAMSKGVAHYRINGASAFPGEVGNTVITGHSAGDIYSNNQYKFIFSGLERLEDGDLIYIHYDSTRYTYRVTKKEVVEPTDVSALVYATDRPVLTLVTCTPLGTSRYRLLVTAEQISPDYDSSDDGSTSSSADVSTNPTTNLPSNEPSFFEHLWGALTGR